MEKKICTKCREEKEERDFNFRKDRGYFTTVCRQCILSVAKKVWGLNKEKLNQEKREYYRNNKDKKRQYEKNNRDKIYQTKRRYFLKNKEEIKEKYGEKKKLWRLNNKEKIKQWRINNSEKIKKWHKDNSPKLNEKRRLRCETDSLFKLSMKLRCRVSSAFKRKNWQKRGKATEMLLGCTFEVAKYHIERQFAKGMTWSNHGKWHIDHIIPLSSAKTEEELIALCHYTNLQPLWAVDNLSKKNKLNWTKPYPAAC